MLASNRLIIRKVECWKVIEAKIIKKSPKKFQSITMFENVMY